MKGELLQTSQNKGNNFGIYFWDLQLQPLISKKVWYTDSQLITALSFLIKHNWMSDFSFYWLDGSWRTPPPPVAAYCQSAGWTNYSAWLARKIHLTISKYFHLKKIKIIKKEQSWERTANNHSNVLKWAAFL